MISSPSFMQSGGVGQNDPILVVDGFGILGLLDYRNIFLKGGGVTMTHPPFMQGRRGGGTQLTPPPDIL